MGFHDHFLTIVDQLNTNACSQVLVNGFLTKKIYLERGVRQGDPLSLYLFLIAVEPFVSALQTSPNIEGIRIPGRHIIACPSYADDVTLTLMGQTSVQQASSLLCYFEKASALKLNMEKTHGLYCPRLPSTNQLPSIAWTDEHIRLLGVVIGKSSRVGREWNEVLNNFRKTTKHLSSYLSISQPTTFGTQYTTPSSPTLWRHLISEPYTKYSLYPQSDTRHT